MPTLVDSSEALAVEVSCSGDALAVVLDEGRTVSVPLVCFPRLLNATPAERGEWELIGGGIGIHWEAVDEDIIRGQPAAAREVHAPGWPPETPSARPGKAAARSLGPQEKLGSPRLISSAVCAGWRRAQLCGQDTRRVFGEPIHSESG